MGKYKTVQLEEVCSIQQGGKRGLSGKNFVEDGFPAYGAGGLNGLLPEFEFDQPAVILSSIGARCGKCFYVDGKWSSLANVQLIFPDLGKVHPKYLWYQLNDEKRWPRHGTGQPYIRPSDVKEHQIYLPSLEEQKRIAAMLDKADELRRKRRESISALDSLTQSIFLHLFGDPVSNPKKLPRKPISKFGDVITGNTPSRKQPEFYGNDIEWIKSDNINTPNHVLTPSTEGLSEKGKMVARTVPSNSILVTCIAGSKQCIGNAAMADREVAFNQQINAIVPDEKTDSLFLYVQILVGKKLIQNASTQSMKGMVSKSAFSAVKLLSPPENEQLAFGKKVAAIFRQRTRLLTAQNQTENLFTALQQKAFAQ